MRCWFVLEQSSPLVAAAPEVSSPGGGCMTGVCADEKLTVAIQGCFCDCFLIHSIVASTGNVPRNVRERMSVGGTCSTVPSS